MIKHPYLQASNKPNIINYYNFFIEKTAGGDIYPKKSKPQFDINTYFDEYNNSYTLFIGNKISCVRMTINIIDKTAELQDFNYSPLCSTNKNLPRGLGNKKMMETILKFSKKKFNINKVELTDLSKIKCVNPITGKNIYEIPVYYLFIFKYGLPYYVKTFGFKFSSEIDKKTNERNTLKINEFIIDKIFYKNLYKEFEFYNIDNLEIKWFINNLQSYNTITNFIKNWKYTSECHIFFVFLNFLFRELKLDMFMNNTFYLSF